MPIMQTLGPNFFNLPAAAIVLGGLVNPVTQAFYLSFFDWKIGTSFEDAPYVGFRHFLRMVYDADVHESIWVTLKFGFWTILIEMVLGITLALLLEKPIRADQSSEPFSSSR